MGQVQKDKLKMGVASLGAVITIGLFLFSGSYAYTTLVAAQVNGVKTQVAEQATQLATIETNTCFIINYLCSKDKSQNCPLPKNCNVTQ